MGTRNMTVVIKDNNLKLSQYGQWDGYYSCTGKKFLEFCRENLAEGTYGRNSFPEKIDLCKQVTEDFDKFMDKTIAEYGHENSKEFGIPFSILFPQMSRNTGVRILNIIDSLASYEFDEGQFYPIQIMQEDGWDIEYVNIIDLDNNMVYMLTSHRFNGEVQETTDLVKEHFTYNKCYLKFSLDEIPPEEVVDKKVKELGLD